LRKYSRDQIRGKASIILAYIRALVNVP